MNPNPDTDERVERLIEHLKSNPVVCVCKPFCVHWEVHAKKVLTPLLDSQAATIPYCLNCWHAVPHNGPAGTVDDACTHEGCNCGYYTPAPSEDAATRMREACVDAIKTLRATPRGAAYNNAINDAIHKVESLTLEQVEQEKQT